MTLATLTPRCRLSTPMRRLSPGNFVGFVVVTTTVLNVQHAQAPQLISAAVPRVGCCTAAQGGRKTPLGHLDGGGSRPPRTRVRKAYLGHQGAASMTPRFPAVGGGSPPTPSRVLEERGREPPQAAESSSRRRLALAVLHHHGLHQVMAYGIVAPLLSSMSPVEALKVTPTSTTTHWPQER